MRQMITVTDIDQAVLKGEWPSWEEGGGWG